MVDRAQRSALDASLNATADAVRIVGDVHRGKLTVDAGDRAQFRSIVGAKTQSAIFDTSSHLLVSTDDRTAATFVPAIAHVATGSFFESDGRERLRVYAEPVDVNGSRVGIALAWTDSEGIERLDRSVAAGFGLAIPFLVALATVAGSAIARRGLQPLDRIASLAERIEGHDLTGRLALPNRGDELGRFAASFDRMLDRLQSAFARERRFTSDASHELRAPLSVIRAEADLALRGEREPSEYRRALGVIASEADSLESLTRDLLAAARDERGEAAREPVDLANVAAVVSGRFATLASARDIHIACTAPAAIGVAANAELLERAVTSAVHNALKYAKPGGNVGIAVSGDANLATLVVSDDGPGFSPLALERAFDRFWRDEDVRAEEGHGLGLSIARTIVERFGGTIDLANATPHGAIVRFTFPAFAAQPPGGASSK